MTTKKIIVFGLDGASFNFLDLLIRKGALPNIKRLIDVGVSSDLRSVIPPWTAPAWTSIVCGKNPGKHGIYDFLKTSKKTRDSRVVSSLDVNSRCIWDYLTEWSKFSIVINVPLTFPPRKINGIIIPGFMSPENPTCYPKEIMKELKNVIGDYRIYSKYGTDEQVKPTKRINEYLKLIKMRRDAALFFAQKHDWDFLMVQFQETDEIFHAYPDSNKIRILYQKVDCYIDEILSSIGTEVNVFIISDHGIGKYDGWKFYINTWLKKEGLLKTKIDDKYLAWYDGKKKLVDRSKKTIFWDCLFKVIRRTGLTVQGAEKLFSDVKLDKKIRGLLPDRLFSIISFEQVDIGRSKAYCLHGIGLGIRLNVKCRSRNNEVLEYNKLREVLLSKLKNIKDPEGKLVFEEVLPREMVYKGSKVKEAPDIILKPRKMNYLISERMSYKEFERVNTYDHKMMGLFIASGPDILKGKLKKVPTVYDIAPTILYAMRIPTDVEMDGEILAIFNNNFKNRKPIYKRYSSYHPQWIL